MISTLLLEKTFYNVYLKLLCLYSFGLSELYCNLKMELPGVLDCNSINAAFKKTLGHDPAVAKDGVDKDEILNPGTLPTKLAIPEDWLGRYDNIIGALLIFIAMFTCWLCGWIGGGDMKLAPGLALFLGAQPVLYGVILATAMFVSLLHNRSTGILRLLNMIDDNYVFFCRVAISNICINVI